MRIIRRLLARSLRGMGTLISDSHAVSLRGRTLVFAPHPDDEVLGCGGTIARKVAAGAAVHVVIMTDGSQSHARYMDSRQLVELRHQEACAASVALGLSVEAYDFLNFPDGGLAANRDHAIKATREIIDRFDPAEVFVPHRKDAQPDHEATFDVVTQALQGRARAVDVYEYPVWLWNAWPFTLGVPRQASHGWLAHRKSMLVQIMRLTLGCRVRVDVSDVRERKLEALRAYRSQVERRDGNLQWPVLADVSDGEFVEILTGRNEMFRKSRWGS